MTGVRSGFSKNGNAYGIVTIEDYEGPGELAIFGDDWGKVNSKFLIGSSVFVEILLSQRYQGSSYIDFVVDKVSYLNDVKEKNLRSITINIDPTALSEVTVENLTTLINENPGNTEVYFCVNGVDSEKRLLLRSGNCRRNINRNVLDFVKENEGIEYKIN